MQRCAFVFLLLGCGSSSTTPTTTDAGSDTATAATDTAVADTGTATMTDTLPDPWEGGAPSAACVTHCECMTTTCATGSPYTTTKDCTDHCGRFTAAEMKCWSYFCTEAAKSSGSTKTHMCQHAWGTWGLEECPK
jgi:hypothetical protein